MKHQKDKLFWVISLLSGIFLAGLVLGAGIQLPEPVPFWMTLPFIGLLLAIAFTPLVNPHWWHRNYPNVSLFMGGFVAALYAFGYAQGPAKVIHTGMEYLAFLALIGGLFFVVSCIELEVSGRSRPFVNTALLFFGAVISNILGTTGASLLLIRPYIKINRARIQPLHIVFFIIIVSNCGGALTPVGDPPLYLGYLKGVPFNWTLINLWQSWLLVLSCLLFAFYIFDYFFVKTVVRNLQKDKISFKIRGRTGVICLFFMIAAVFLDPLLAVQSDFKGVPMTAIAQIIIAASCFMLTPLRIKQANEFTFEPFKEVALIFAGIFATMIPALEYLSIHGAGLGINSPKIFYYATGMLSAFLDNAPTYLNFLQVAIGPEEITRSSVSALIANPLGKANLAAISSGAVFFGALTYIGNGPNFMVRSISESMKARTPSFFGYIGMALIILLPILILNSLIAF